jgi:hypothetical protein
MTEYTVRIEKKFQEDTIEIASEEALLGAEPVGKNAARIVILSPNEKPTVEREKLLGVSE